jgi:tetratricopeptide (TPR) repeat protein
MIAALVVRNLFVLMLKHGEIAKAQQFLALGINSYSGYAELSYLAALLAVREQRFAQALPFLQKAKSRESGFLGSGGESSYRAAWLLGFLAARVGNHRVAFGHFLTGLNSTPVFLPAVEELLNLRLPPRTIEAHQYDFCRAVRREPRLLDKVFAYLLLHRAFEAAQRIARTIPMVDQQRAQLEDQLAAASAPFHGAANSQSAKTGVVLSGPFFEHTSLARSIAKLPAACFIRNIPQAPGASTCASSLRRHASSRRKCSQAAIYWSSRCFAIRRDLISPSATSGRPTCAAHHGESWR